LSDPLPMALFAARQKKVFTEWDPADFRGSVDGL
jgi:hypothetical protein